MKHFLMHTLMCLVSCAIFHVLDARFHWTHALLEAIGSQSQVECGGHHEN